MTLFNLFLFFVPHLFLQIVKKKTTNRTINYLKLLKLQFEKRKQ
jgi:hypothetical protein